MAHLSPTRLRLQRWISHPLQGLLANGLFALIGCLGFRRASNLGGWIGRTFGPKFRITNIARRNLALAFPEKTDAEREKIVLGMWENLGRVVFEFPHIPKLDVYRDHNFFEVIGLDKIDLLRDDNQPGIFFSGHISNWETTSLSIAQFSNPIALSLIFREPDNPWVRKLFDQRRPPGASLIPKGAKGARQALNVLKNGGHLAMLVDQKMNDGIKVPFFGHDAMCAPAIAQFALKYNCPLVPVRAQRLNDGRYRITLFDPLEIKLTGDRQADIEAIMIQINQILEEWIRDCPEQWLWLHRRWPQS